MDPSSLKILALIPARAGSQRVKNKNLRLLDRRPLISYTIKQAKKSKLINRIIVSTDSESIANISLGLGAEIPFMRPESFAQSHSTEYEFTDHAIQWLNKSEKYIPDYIVNLYPTSPFRKPESIDQAILKIISSKDADSLRSVTKCTEHPYKMWTQENDYLSPFIQKEDEGVHTLSYQLLPPVYIQNASIYITKVSTLKKYKNTVGKKVLSFITNPSESVDINYPQDFEFAEYKIKTNTVTME